MSFSLPDHCIPHLCWNQWISHWQVTAFQIFFIFFPTSFVTAVMFTHMLPKQQGSFFDRRSLLSSQQCRGGFPLSPSFISLFMSSSELTRTVREEVHVNLKTQWKKGLLLFSPSFFASLVTYYCQPLMNDEHIFTTKTFWEKFPLKFILWIKTIYFSCRN